MNQKNLKIEGRTKMKKMDIVGELHPDLAYQILKLLDLKDWASCWYTCRRWRDLIGDDYFWKLVCEQQNFLKEPFFFKSAFVRKEDYWQLVHNYYAAAKISWTSGLFEEVNYSQYSFTDILYLDDEIVVGCIQFDTFAKIIIINHLERKVQATLEKHEFFCTDFVIFKAYRYKNFLITYFNKFQGTFYYYGAWEGTRTDLNNNTTVSMVGITVWHTTNSIFCENFIASVIPTKQLRLYNIETNKTEYRCEDVTSFGITSSRLAILKNNAVKVVNLKDYSECMLIPCKKIMLVKTVLASSTLILSICSTGHVCCWCAETENELQHFSLTFDDDYEGVLSLHNEKLIYYDMECGSTEVWDVRTGSRQFVIKNLFYIISCNSRYMAGVNVGEQRVDVRCFESGKLLVNHINGMNISELHSSKITRIFSLFLEIRKQYTTNRESRNWREMRNLYCMISCNPALQIAETCLAITKIIKPSKLSKFNIFKRKKGPKVGITVYHVKF